MEAGKKEDREEEHSPYAGVEKNAIMHQAGVFNQTPIVPHECCTVLTRIMYLLVRGEPFTEAEAEKLFFGVTKLFQSKDAMLRRMVYLVVKTLGRDQENVFIVINCLSKDITSGDELFEANAIRVLAKVINAGHFGQMERFIRQAVVSKSEMVASAALVAGINLFRLSPEVVKRWVNEVQAALKSKSAMVQFHALNLLYMVKKHDRLAIAKVVHVLTKSPPKSAVAHCLLLRYTVGVLLSGEGDAVRLMGFLQASLRHRDQTVAYEAAKALCFLPDVSAQVVAPAIAVLQEMLGSNVAVRRFAAVRTLNRVVAVHPSYVAPCTVGLEMLIGDTNRNIATLAITTLLQTRVESNVDRLLQTTLGFMTDIPDELRILLVEAVHVACLAFPGKYVLFYEFLTAILREDGGFGYKKAIVDTYTDVMNKVPGSKAAALDSLCEFIEDCEFPSLSVRVLGLLGEEGPMTDSPSRYIRFIFNRVILEQPRVRAAAVACLGRFGYACPSLAPNVLKLLQYSLMDNDDEVRDRAVYYTQALAKPQQGIAAVVCPDTSLPFHALEYSLLQYLEGPGEQPFSMDDVVFPEEARTEDQHEEDTIALVDTVVGAPALSALFEAVPALAGLGDVFASSVVVDLTESEAEYRVTCVKHIFQEHVLFQFHVTNNMEEQLLADVTVDLETEWTVHASLPIESLPPGKSDVAYVCLERDPEALEAAFPATLRFFVQDPSFPEDEGDEDEYMLEEVALLFGDLVKPGDDMSLSSFRPLWEETGSDSEVLKKFALGSSRLQDAVDAVVQLLRMRAIDGSQTVKEGAKSHTVNLYGLLIGDHPIYARTGFMLNAKGNVVLKIACRSDDAAISEAVVAAIQ